MKALSTASLVCLVSLVTAACFEDVVVGSDTDSGAVTPDGGVDGGKACASSADCAANETCGFATSAACAAKGTCFALAGAMCLAYSPGCACDGTEINVACTGLPTGYATKALAHAGACGTDAGPAPGACASNADCPTGDVCAFPAVGGCGVLGSCVVAPAGANCQAYVAGCACDGTEVNLTCNGFQAGYQSKPISHTGACSSPPPVDAGGFDAGAFCTGSTARMTINGADAPILNATGSALALNCCAGAELTMSVTAFQAELFLRWQISGAPGTYDLATLSTPSQVEFDVGCDPALGSCAAATEHVTSGFQGTITYAMSGAGLVASYCLSMTGPTGSPVTALQLYAPNVASP